MIDNEFNLTREVVKTLLFFNNREDEKLVYEVIDKIYDSFESQTCDSCKYYANRGTSPNDNYCVLNISDCNTNNIITLGFGCKKWKAKNKDAKNAIK